MLSVKAKLNRQVSAILQQACTIACFLRLRVLCNAAADALVMSMTDSKPQNDQEQLVAAEPTVVLP